MLFERLNTVEVEMMVHLQVNDRTIFLEGDFRKDQGSIHRNFIDKYSRKFDSHCTQFSFTVEILKLSIRSTSCNIGLNSVILTVIRQLSLLAEESQQFIYFILPPSFQLHLALLYQFGFILFPILITQVNDVNCLNNSGRLFYQFTVCTENNESSKLSGNFTLSCYIC